MGRWALKDKNGKYRSRKSFKQDCARNSQEPWEKEDGFNLIINPFKKKKNKFLI